MSIFEWLGIAFVFLYSIAVTIRVVEVFTSIPARTKVDMISLENSKWNRKLYHAVSIENRIKLEKAEANRRLSELEKEIK